MTNDQQDADSPETSSPPDKPRRSEFEQTSTAPRSDANTSPTSDQAAEAVDRATAALGQDEDERHGK